MGRHVTYSFSGLCMIQLWLPRLVKELLKTVLFNVFVSFFDPFRSVSLPFRPMQDYSQFSSIFTVARECLAQQAVCGQIVRMIVGELQWKLACVAAGRVTKSRRFRLSATQANGKHNLVVGLCHECFFASELRDYLLGHVRSLKSLDMIKGYVLKDYGVNWR